MSSCRTTKEPDLSKFSFSEIPMSYLDESELRRRDLAGQAEDIRLSQGGYILPQELTPPRPPYSEPCDTRSWRMPGWMLAIVQKLKRK